MIILLRWKERIADDGKENTENEENSQTAKKKQNKGDDNKYKVGYS